MEVASPAELTTLRAEIQNASLATDAKHTALWCVAQLPQLYADFQRTNESRFEGKIRGLALGVLKCLAGDDAGPVSAAVVTQLTELHRRLGLAPLYLKLPAPAKGRKKKAS